MPIALYWKCLKKSSEHHVTHTHITRAGNQNKTVATKKIALNSYDVKRNILALYRPLPTQNNIFKLFHQTTH